jgi:hypothetical protein
MGQANVHALRPRDRDMVEPDHLVDLMVRMTDQHGSAAVGDTLDELAQRLSQIGPAWRDGRFDEIAQLCRRVAEIATELELDRLARVARTALALVACSDGVALAANLGRLMRMGEAMLTTIWQMQDASV